MRSAKSRPTRGDSSEKLIPLGEQLTQDDVTAATRQAASELADFSADVDLTGQTSERIDVGFLPGLAIDGQHRFGRFELRRLLGSGGYGFVYLAYDPKLQREIALKLPNLHVASLPRKRRRFLREVQAASKLNHPNIVQVFEADFVDSIPYIVSMVCHGPNLAVWLSDRMRSGEPVPVRVAASWMTAVASAIEFAHQTGIVHRDLKPSNILLRPGVESIDPVDFVPLVTDFGFAKDLNADTEVTKTGTVLGTLSYMAPEQAEDSDHGIGPAADIYSLGVVLYELLTGRLPIRGKTTVDILQRLVTAEPDPIHATRTDIPKDLESICMKCLAKLPQDRYASASDLSADLQRFLDGDIVHAHPVSRTRLLARRASRMRFSWTPVITILAGLTAMVIIAFGLGLRLSDRSASLSDLSARHSTSSQRLETLESAREAQLRSGYALDVDKASQKWQQATDEVCMHPAITEEMERLLSAYRPLPGEPDIRGPEWHFLWNASHPAEFTPPWRLLRTIQAHEKEVFGLAFSHDGQRIASGSADQKVRIWNTENGELLQTLSGHSDDVNWTSWTPDDRLLATAADDATVRVWNVNGDGSVRTLKGLNEWVYTSEFSPDGKRLAASDTTGLLKAWQTDEFEELCSIQAHDHRIRYVAWSPDGQFLTTVSDSNSIKIWNADQWTLEQSLGFGPDARPNTVAYSSDSRFIAVGGETSPEAAFDGMVKIYDVASGRNLGTSVKHRLKVQSVAFVPGRLAVVSTADDHRTIVWDLVSGQQWEPFAALPLSSRRLTFSNDGSRCAIGSEDGSVRIWDSRVGPGWILAYSTKRLSSYLKILPHTNQLVIGMNEKKHGTVGKHGIVAKWDFDTAFPSQVAEMVSSEVHGVNLSGDGKELFIGMAEPTGAQMMVVDAGTFAIQENFSEAKRGDRILPGSQLHFAARPRGSSVIAGVSFRGGSDWVLSFFDRYQTQAIIDLTHYVGLTSMAGSLDSELLAISYFENHVWNVRVYEVATQAVISTIQDLGLHTVAFGPHDVLAIGEDHGRISTWDARRGERIVTFSIEDVRINGLAFNSDGDRLIALTPSQLILFAMPEGRELCRLDLPMGTESFAFHKCPIQVTANGTIVAIVRRGPYERLIAWRPDP